MGTNTPDYERFAHDWGNGESAKIAIGVAFDEQLIARFKSFDWDDTHATFEPEYQFETGREGAWAVDADSTTLATVRERTGLGIPPIGECPINTHPFGQQSNKSAIEVITQRSPSVSRTCHRCGESSMLSWRDYRGVYKSAQSLRTELLLDPDADPTHICMSCHILLSVPEDPRSSMARAMGAPEDGRS